MKNEKPVDATHIESDGTYWKLEGGIWTWWNGGWGWCQYIGIVNHRFTSKFIKL